MVESVCRVCGFDDVGEERWTGPGGAQYVVCPCCGAESGVDDHDLPVARRYRAAWRAAGCSWFDPERRPDEWSADKQSERIPPAWR